MAEWTRDLFLGHRSETLRAEVLNQKNEVEREVTHLISFNITGGWLDDIKTAGSMSLHDTGHIDWLTERFKLYYSVNGVEFPMGIYIPGTPTGPRLSGNTARTVEFYDRTMILHQDQLVEHEHVEKDALVLDEIIAEIVSTGETPPARPSSALRTNHSVTWKPGTTRLRKVHDLLGASGYRNLGVNRDGDFVISRNTPGTDSTPVWVFRDNEYEGIVRDGFTDEVDLMKVPNQWIGWSRTDGEEPGYFTIQQNLDENDPLSIPRRGRVISRTTEDVEAASQAVLDSIIRGNLTDATNATREIVFEHPWVPLELEDMVEFHNTEHGVHVKARVTHFEQNFTLPGAMCRTTIRVAESL